MTTVSTAGVSSTIPTRRLVRNAAILRYSPTHWQTLTCGSVARPAGLVSLSQKHTPLMTLELASGLLIDSPTEADLSRIDGEGFAILSRDPDTYMQCAEDVDRAGEYVLEYQDGGLDRHYHAVDGPITLQRVTAAFGKYLAYDRSWLFDFEWERLDLP